MKRTPLTRKTALARGTKRLSAKSKKREVADAEHVIIRERVFARDRHRCQLAGHHDACFGPLTPHHIVKASQGGPYTADNLVTLCAHHNDAIEADVETAAIARRLGWVRFGWEGVAT